MFLRLLRVTADDKILDVGGNEETWFRSGLEACVTILNIALGERRQQFKYIEGDGCDMHMVQDRSFDVVFSNSVIEHVGHERQGAFAKEIRRVGSRYWVQTPYKHFPIEPHFLFPFFQYLPQELKEYVGLRWRYSHLKAHGEDIISELSRLRLLSKTDMRALFPEAELMSERWMGLTKSLIAYKP